MLNYCNAKGYKVDKVITEFGSGLNDKRPKLEKPLNESNFCTNSPSQLINLIAYKSKLMGIKVLIKEESYTSKTPFLDNNHIPT